MTGQGVCVVTHPLNAAGENATRTLLDILAAIGPVALITADLPENSSIWSDREVIELTAKGTGESVPIAAVRFLLNQFRMCREIRDRPEDVMLFFGATSYIIPILFAKTIGKTVLVEPRGDVPLTLRLNWKQQLPEGLSRSLAGVVRLLERGGFAAADCVITYTPSMARELNLDPGSPRVYPHGARYVDTEEFTPRQPFEDRRDVVGFVGRIDEEKGIRELADAAQELPDDISFRFIGDGPLLEWLESELATEIGDGTVELAGWVDHDDVPAELSELRLLVLPSQPTEGLPTTILEALACGTPVLATPVAGIPDVVQDGDTGFLLHERTPEAIADRIETILSSGDLPQISENGRKLILEEYSFSAAQDRYRELFSEYV